MLLERCKKIIEKGYVCDHCLGRQFAQILSGLSNEERGKALRTAFFMAIDSGEISIEENGKGFENILKNIGKGIKFHFRKDLNIKIEEIGEKEKEEKCYLCGNIFERIDEIAENVVKELNNYEYNTFHLGAKLPEWMENREIELWEEIGAEFSESLRNELTRAVGKKVQEMTGKEVDLKNPDIVVILNLERNIIECLVRSLFIYGKYNKYKEMPQARWVCRYCQGVGCKRCDWKGKLYEESVQDCIGEILADAFEAEDTRFHGAGREDIDALCTGWREFVIELVNPMKRNTGLKELEKKINEANKGKIEVKDLKIVDKEKVREIKEKRSKKRYKVIIDVIGYVDEEKLKKLVGKEILLHQRTPKRVEHRRSDKIRKRKVKILGYEIKKDENELIIDVEADAGTYIKEFVSGDEGRTKPSLASLLSCEMFVKKLIVTGFEY